jgi:hypothetical protein
MVSGAISSFPIEIIPVEIIPVAEEMQALANLLYR